MISLFRLLVVVGGILLTTAARADTYPSRPITIIVPFGAGSGTDTIARIIAQYLGTALKQNILVENKPGANGGIAAAYVARAAADGYTLFLSTNSAHSVNPSLLRSISYDPVKDFAPISRIGSFTLILVANPELPVRSIQQLIAYAKANPGQLSFASGNTSGIVAGETFKNWAGIDILHVPYKSVPPALSDVLGGRVSMAFSDLTPALPLIRVNSLRPLAVTRLQRSALIPDVPSLHEVGLTGFEVDAWAGLFAPAKTPPEIITRLNGELRTIIDDPDIRARFAAIGFEAFASTPEELADFVKVQLVKWSRMVREAGIEPE